MHPCVISEHPLPSVAFLSGAVQHVSENFISLVSGTVASLLSDCRVMPDGCSNQHTSSDLCIKRHPCHFCHFVSLSAVTQCIVFSPDSSNILRSFRFPLLLYVSLLSTRLSSSSLLLFLSLLASFSVSLSLPSMTLSFYFPPSHSKSSLSLVFRQEVLVCVYILPGHAHACPCTVCTHTPMLEHTCTSTCTHQISSGTQQHKHNSYIKYVT